MKKGTTTKPLLKSWIRTIAIAAAIVIFIVIASIIFLSGYTRHGERFMLPSFAGMTMEEANALNEEMEIKFDVLDSIYVEAMLPGAIIDQYPKAGNFIKSGRRVSVTINTYAPKNVKIPYVTGYSLRQAKNRLASSGLQIEKLVYVPDIATNNVLRQEYQGTTISGESNVTVPVNSKITLYVGLAESATPFTTPDLLGEVFYVAKDRLWEEGLNLSSTEHEKMSRMQSQKAIVYKQNPVPGEPIQYGDVVQLYISADSAFVSNNVKASQFKAKKIAELRIALKEAEETIKGSSVEDMIEQQLIIEHINNQIDSLK